MNSCRLETSKVIFGPVILACACCISFFKVTYQRLFTCVKQLPVGLTHIYFKIGIQNWISPEYQYRNLCTCISRFILQKTCLQFLLFTNLGIGFLKNFIKKADRKLALSIAKQQRIESYFRRSHYVLRSNATNRLDTSLSTISTSTAMSEEMPMSLFSSNE